MHPLDLICIFLIRFLNNVQESDKTVPMGLRIEMTDFLNKLLSSSEVTIVQVMEQLNVSFKRHDVVFPLDDYMRVFREYPKCEKKAQICGGKRADHYLTSQEYPLASETLKELLKTSIQDIELKNQEIELKNLTELLKAIRCHAASHVSSHAASHV